MQEKLVKFKHLIMNKAGQPSDLYFDTRFSDSGFYAWKTEADRLILIDKKGSKNPIELMYDSVAVKFKGTHEGQPIEIYPPTQIKDEFANSLRFKRDVTLSSKIPVKKTKKFAVASKQRMREFDVYQYRSGLIECFSRMFNKGYEMAIYSQGLTVEQINLLSQNPSKTVMHVHSDYRKWWGFSITKEFWDSLGALNRNHNFFKNLEDRLAEKRVEAEYLENK